jgi:hypothetical protein
MLTLLLDAILALMHRRANRIVEQVDWDHFGQHDSWTKAFYLPEALCVYLLLRDLLDAVIPGV